MIDPGVSVIDGLETSMPGNIRDLNMKSTRAQDRDPYHYP